VVDVDFECVGEVGVFGGGMNDYVDLCLG